MAEVVVDASALVDLLLGGDLGRAVARRLHGAALHAPSHLEAEVLSALGRLHRAGELEADRVRDLLVDVVAAPIQHHSAASLVLGAWERRHNLRLADALYVELAAARRSPLITTDGRLHAVPGAEVVAG